MEEIRGEEVHTNFEDPECGQESDFPSDDESSSDEDDVEEVYADHVPPR